MSLKATKLPENSPTLLNFTGLTDGGEDACKAEVVHSVKREQVEQKLLPFFLTEQECMRFIQLPVGGQEQREKKKKSVKVMALNINENCQQVSYEGILT